MDAWVWIVIIVAAIAVIGFVAWTLGTKRHTERLQSRFGPEYERTVEQAESRKEAESELSARMKRRQDLENSEEVHARVAGRASPFRRPAKRGSEGCRPPRHAFDAGARLPH